MAKGYRGRKKIKFSASISLEVRFSYLKVNLYLPVQVYPINESSNYDTTSVIFR